MNSLYENLTLTHPCRSLHASKYYHFIIVILENLTPIQHRILANIFISTINYGGVCNDVKWGMFVCCKMYTSRHLER